MGKWRIMYNGNCPDYSDSYMYNAEGMEKIRVVIERLRFDGVLLREEWMEGGCPCVYVDVLGSVDMWGYIGAEGVYLDIRYEEPLYFV